MALKKAARLSFAVPVGNPVTDGHTEARIERDALLYLQNLKIRVS